MTTDVLFDPHQEEGLNHMQALRRRIVDLFTVDDTTIRSLAEGEISLLKSMMDGFDKSVFTKTKLKVTAKRDEQTNDNAKRTAMIIRGLSVMNHRPETSASERTLPETDMARTFLPVEMEIGVEPINIDQVIT